VYPARFDYVVPRTLGEAVGMLQDLGPDTRVLAGGQSLIPLMRLRQARPSHIVDLQVLPLAGIRTAPGDPTGESGITIGSMTTHASLERSPGLRERYPLLADVARHIGDPVVRNLGTIGGAVAFAHPAGDWGPALIAVGATFLALGPRGEREIPADEFFIGPHESSLEPAELLVGIRVARRPGSGGAYAKFRRRVGDFAVVGVAVQLTLDDRGLIEDCDIAVTGVDLNYVRANKAQEALIGGRAGPESLRLSARIVAEQSHPISDHRGSAEWKREMVKVLAFRSLGTAAIRAGMSLRQAPAVSL
jgi:aerobic carbon-monoxide dehydrogenase medium subunit